MEEKAKGGYMDADIVVALFFISIIAIVGLVFYIQTKLEDEKQKKAFLAEKIKYSSFYARNDLRTLTKMPSIYEVSDDGYPREKNIPYGYCYGKTIDVYIARNNSNVYHALGCPHVAYHQPCNVFTDYYSCYLPSRRPCTHCNPPPLPDVTWYKEYVAHLEVCRKYDIKPIKEPPPYEPRVYIEYRE